MITILCKNCKKEFKDYQSNGRVFCSRNCSSISKVGVPNVKNSIALKGRKLSQESIQKRTESRKGYKHSEQTKRKIGQTNSIVLLGKKQSPETIERRASKFRGENHYRWIEDRTKVKLDKERGGPLHKQWSKDVKKRDNWKCRIADENCDGKVVAHHILGWAKYPELRYQVNNGITLCRFHHPLKREDENKLSPYFQELVAQME